MNRDLCKRKDINIWRNTSSIIDWLKQIKDKNKHSFIIFDVCDLYPSITKELLEKALDYASKFTTITKEHREIIIHAKSAILFHNSTTWTKTNSNNFDVMMGSYDGAEICELLGTYLLSLIPNKYKNDIGLYRDDGLAVSTGTPRETENMKRKICKIFKEHKLKITIEANK